VPTRNAERDDQGAGYTSDAEPVDAFFEKPPQPPLNNLSNRLTTLRGIVQIRKAKIAQNNG
jgi:hypothetical protein